MAIICWGSLAKAADSTQKIEQAMMGYIETHDENPNAHMGPDYALGAHRLQVELDHLPYSILNKFLYPQSRTYKAVVDRAGYGDNDDIQDAIDYVHGLGGGAIFIKKNTYTLTDDLILYSDIHLIGEDDDDCILDFNSLAKGIKAVGNGGGRLKNIILNSLKVQNSKISSGSGVLFQNVDDADVLGCKFTGNDIGSPNTSFDIYLATCNRIRIEDCHSYSSCQFMSSSYANVIKVLYNHIEDCRLSGIEFGIGNGNWANFNYIDTPGHRGIDVNAGSTWQLIGNIILEWVNHGINIGGASDTFDGIIEGNHLEENGEEYLTKHGIEIGAHSNNGLRIIGNRINATSGDGINFIQGTKAVIVGNRINAGRDYGIHLCEDVQNSEVIANVTTSETGVQDDGLNNDCNHNINA
jgi:hypothetical protein